MHALSKEQSFVALTFPTLAVKTPAKLNLTLAVLGRRDDGYHELDSIVCGLEWFDTLVGRLSAKKGIQFDCDDAALAGPHNLVYQSAAKLAQRFGPDRGIRLTLSKHIPVGAGLGGGSSDAAATLMLCNRLWELGLSDEQLMCLGAEIGSDVPLFFSLPCAKISGRGERVEPLALPWVGWVVLVGLDIPVSTGKVYHGYLSKDAQVGTRGDVERVQIADSAKTLSGCLFNDLERAVFRTEPTVAEMFQRVRRLGFDSLRVCGAGSTFYLLADDRPTAQKMARRIMDARLQVEIKIVRRMTTPMLMERP